MNKQQVFHCIALPLIFLLPFFIAIQEKKYEPLSAIFGLVILEKYQLSAYPCIVFFRLDDQIKIVEFTTIMGYLLCSRYQRGKFFIATLTFLALLLHNILEVIVHIMSSSPSYSIILEGYLQSTEKLSLGIYNGAFFLSALGIIWQWRPPKRYLYPIALVFTGSLGITLGLGERNLIFYGRYCHSCRFSSCDLAYICGVGWGNYISLNFVFSHLVAQYFSAEEKSYQAQKDALRYYYNYVCGRGIYFRNRNWEKNARESGMKVSWKKNRYYIWPNAELLQKKQECLKRYKKKIFGLTQFILGGGILLIGIFIFR